MTVNKTTKSVSILVIALFMISAASLRSSAQTVKSQIQRMSGWENCVACAGANAAGPGASISTATTSSPSMSGVSRAFSIASSHPYADALWWKQLGAANGATNLRYDLDFYIQAPQNAQALEFDSNQANGKWISTGIPCKMPAAFKWHHLTWEFKRTASTLTYVAVTLDGVKHYVNRTYTGRRSGTNELNVAFQEDMRGNHVAFKTWLDNVKLTYW